VEEVGVGPEGRVLVEIDPRYIRPTEVDHLQGNASKARDQLGWRFKVGFEELVAMMVDRDLAQVTQSALISVGY